MSDLVAFLNARLDEDEAEANRFHDARLCGSFQLRSCEQVLREVEAKRKILELHQIHSEPEIKTIDHIDKRFNTGWVERQETGRLSYWCVTCDDDRDYGHIGGPEEGCPTVRALAAVYSDHPDYQQEWA